MIENPTNQIISGVTGHAVVTSFEVGRMPAGSESVVEIEDCPEVPARNTDLIYQAFARAFARSRWPVYDLGAFELFRTPFGYANPYTGYGGVMDNFGNLVRTRRFDFYIDDSFIQ